MKKLHCLLAVGLLASSVIPAMATNLIVSDDVAADVSRLIAPTEAKTVNVQPAGTKNDYQAWTQTSGSQGVRVQATDLNGDGQADIELKVTSTETGGNEASRVLPTVNKKTDASAQRVLPTVNKRTAKVTVRGWDTEKKELIENLEKNAAATVEADENIAELQVSPDKIEMKYKRSAKLFGFIPVAYHHAFTVDDKGNVAQGHPWWLALAKDDADNFGSDVKYVFQYNESELRFIKAPTAMEWQIQRFSSLSNIMKTRHEAMMNSIRNIK